jgi:hypothetical protein
MRNLRVAGASLVGALLLAACGGPSASPTLLGSPSLNISVPLNAVGCDDAGICFALGTTGLDIAPNAAAQASVRGQSWQTVATPNAPSTSMNAVSCWRTKCLFGGSNSAGNVVWSSADAKTMSAVRAPSSGLGISALSCFASSRCAAIDTGVDGQARISFTDSAGANWSSPQPVKWARDATALSIACTSDSSCVVTGTTKVVGGSGAIWSETSDGGASWSTSQNAKWIQLIDATCGATVCEALATQSNGLGIVVHSAIGGSSWKPDANQPSKSPGTFACSRSLNCVAVSANSPWLAIEKANKWTTQHLKYVPDPFIAIGCGVTYCVAINSQTTLSIKL